MKSLNTSPTIYKLSFLSDDILTHILNDGFKEGINNSYCYKEYHKEHEWEEKCFVKSYYNDVDINIYIFSDSIGVDIDLECGGNMNTCSWNYENDTEFELAYDSMVEYVNNYR